MYVVIAVAVFVVYRRLRTEHVATDVATVARKPARAVAAARCSSSRRCSRLDAGASGFVVQSLLVLWLHLEWGLSPGRHRRGLLRRRPAERVLAAARGPLARRIGLVRTMVFTHLPANLFLVLAAFAPTAGIAIGVPAGPRAVLADGRARRGRRW